MKLRPQKIMNEEAAAINGTSEKLEKRCLAPGQELVRDGSRDKDICGCPYCPCTANGDSTSSEEPERAGKADPKRKAPASGTPLASSDEEGPPEGEHGADSDSEQDAEPDVEEARDDESQDA